ncbi:MAG TPA: DUF167 domain-containing protein [Vicinamibacterales bacterium]|nr:DUF167 domain-containing protein [Vicinamibacterales bacterium]
MAALQVRVIPRAGRTAIAGRRGDALLIRLAAAPVDGAANEALVDLLSDALAVPRRNISIAAGQRSRDKRIEIDGLDPDTLERRLSAILARG